MKDWSGISAINWLHEQVELGVLPHSAPTSTSLFSSSCRRASSFPLAHATALPSALKVRSQSESTALNRISMKMPYSFYEYYNGRKNSPIRYGKVTFYPQIPERIQSDSEGEDSLVSSDGGISSSDEQDDLANELEDHFDNAPDSQYGDTTFNSTCQYDIVLPKKKSVRFADDCGGCLEMVRIMTEPSDYPPRISPSIIRRYRQAAKSEKKASTSGTDDDDDDSEEEEIRPKASWKIDFTQPASEYVKFRETLENNKVALENVMLKNEQCKIVGTIKVANISFEKRVYVRFTSDGWKSYLDRPAIYQSSPSKSYDTFRFEIEIPMNTLQVSRIEFCICYETNTTEYWDSNSGKNYVLVSPVSPSPSNAPNKANLTRRTNGVTDDVYSLEQVDWTKFASWKNLSTDGPYW
jgi:protein phosphatase 1 regulatory subunit 3A/B/C/D/E